MNKLILKSFVGLLFFLISQSTFSQYKLVECDKKPPTLQIVQIDTTKSSTFIFFTAVNKYERGWMNFGDKTYIKDKKSNKVYKLINSINMPINEEGEPKVHTFDRVGQEHNFCLEFEKLPAAIENFDLIEDESNPNAFNFYGVKIDKNRVSELINVEDFIKSTPVKEFGYNMKDGNVIYYYKHKGLFMSMTLYIDNNYGKYYQVWVDIQNFTGKSLMFNPYNITAKSVLKKGDKNELKDLQVLSYEDYMKKVNSAQAWSAFAVSFGNSLSAINAGYSYSSTNASATGQTNTYGSVSAYAGGTYGYANGYSSSYSTAYGRSTTKSYDGAAAYAAQQNASNNTNAYVQNQYQIKSKLSEGYVKSNSLSNQTEFMGFLNVKYLKTDNITISIPINGETYVFQRSWNNK